MAKRGEPKRINWGLIILLVIIAFIVLMVVSCSVFIFAGEDAISSGNVAVISIKGPISVDSVSGFGLKGTSSDEVIELIEKADEKDSIKAILFDINSGGGGAVASKEIADAVKRAEKPCYAVIREVGASGAYWIASSCDTIIAHEMSITGSISAIASYLEISGLLEHYNVSYQRLVSGPYKDIGSPFKELALDERAILEKLLSRIHEYFVADVAENRGIPIEKIRELATGEFYLGIDALELELVDKLGDMSTAVSIIEDDLNITVDLAEYQKPKSLLDIFAGTFSEQFFFIGKGIGHSMVNSRTINRIDILT